MLVELRVDNHRSIRTEQALTMEASRLDDVYEGRVRQVPGLKRGLLSVAGLYGANGSGKSCLLEALAFLCGAVRFSQPRWDPDEGIERFPFAWGGGTKRPSLFEVTLLAGGVKYQYGFVLDDERFLEEWLFAWPNGRRQVWFERDGETLSFGAQLKGENDIIKTMVRPNSLFLSAAGQFNHPQLMNVYRWFLQVIPFDIHVGYPSDHYQRWRAKWIKMAFEAEPDSPDDSKNGLRLDLLIELIRRIDVGICDVRLEVEELESALSQRRPKTLLKVFFRHDPLDEESWLSLAEESVGTVTFFEMLPAVVETLLTGGVLIIDELDSSLHPHVGRAIIDLFNSTELNHSAGQLLFSTHDTNLLGTSSGEPALRRDQIWLAEKNQRGETNIYPLTDYKPRKGENLERGYLQGRYGAIPMLGELSPLAERSSHG